MRDGSFSTDYWQAASTWRQEMADLYESEANTDPASLQEPLYLVSAAGLAAQARFETLFVLYSSGAAQESLRDAYGLALRALGVERDVCLRITGGLDRFDVVSHRGAYDRALATLSLGVLLDVDAPPLSTWPGAARDAVLAGLAGTDAAALDCAWPRSHATLARALSPVSSGARPAAVREFLKGWYDASRKAPWWGSKRDAEEHPEDVRHVGHWAFEAAAVVKLLDIDDSSFRDAPYYPADLVTRSATPGVPPPRPLGARSERRPSSRRPCEHS